MENKPGVNSEPYEMRTYLRKEANDSFPAYEWAIHRIGQRALTLNLGRERDTMYTSALLAINLYEHIIITDPQLAMNGQIEELREGRASEDQVLAFLYMIEMVVPQLLEGSTHPSVRLWPEEIIGLAALCGLPEDKKERKTIRKAVKGMFRELALTKGRNFGQKLARKHPGIFNGQSLIPEKQGLSLTAAHIQMPTS